MKISIGSKTFEISQNAEVSKVEIRYEAEGRHTHPSALCITALDGSPAFKYTDKGDGFTPPETWGWLPVGVYDLTA